MLPLLTLGLLVFQLDRVNLASALTGGFAKYIKITQDVVTRVNDAAYYPTDVVILIALVAFGLAVVGVQLAVYRIFNRRFEGAKSAGSTLTALQTSRQNLKRGRVKSFGRRVPYVL